MKKITLLLFLFTLSASVFAQATVFSDDFNVSQGAAYSTAGNIGTTNWSISRPGADWGARIDGNILDLTNDASGAANASGWIYVNQPTTNISSPFNTTLGSNIGLVSWVFNMRQIRSNPAGFTSGSYGVAFILGSTTITPQSTGNGYAVVLGNSGTPDPIRLVKYTGGLISTSNITNLIVSNTVGLTGFGVNYLSIKVTYDPTNNTWELFLRDDGAAFADPSSGSLVSQGTIVDNSFTGSALDYFGAYWQGSTSAGQTAYFDNVSVTLSGPVAIAVTNVSATSFNANWNSVGAGATGYYLDVAIDAAFTSPVQGYNNLNVGNVTTYPVAGLTAGVTYHYRVRAYNASGTGPNSNTIDVTTIQLVLSGTEAAALNYTEGNAATIVTSSTIITSSVPNLDGAVMKVTGNYQNGEDLLQINVADLLGGVTATWQAVTGTLTLTGNTSVSDYQAMIRSIKYQNTSQAPSILQRTVSFTASIGAFNSNTITRDISITAVNQASVLAAIELAALSYNTGQAKQITNTITITDVDNTTLVGATIQISANYDNGKDVFLFSNQNGITGTWTSATGTLTLNGVATLALYQAALRSIQFQNTDANASSLQRTVSFTVNDGTDNSNVATRNIDVNNPPVLAAIEGTQLMYSTGDPATQISSTITANDIDNPNLASAVVQFAGYYESGKDVLLFSDQNGITGTWTSATGTLTLNGVATLALYRAALRSITYQNTSATPVKLIRIIRFQVNDGLANSNFVDREINLGFIAPTLTGMEGNVLIYKQGDGEKIVSNTVTLNSPSSPYINSATIQITGNYIQGEDMLICQSQKQIISVWDPVQGKINLSWNTSVENYESTIRSVTYKNVAEHPSTSTRTISFTVSDGYNVTNMVTRDISVSKITNVTTVANPVEGGTITGSGTYYSGDKVTVTAKPNAGCHLVNWTEGDTEVSKDLSFTFTITSDRNLTANFALNKCTIATSSKPTGGGTTTGSGTFDYGTQITVTATPNEGYTFVNWTKGETVVSDSLIYNFTVSDNENLVANFILLPILSVNQNSIPVRAVAGADSIKVSNAGQVAMNWKAVSDIFWIKITSGATGTNSGTIHISYSNNNSVPRVGTVTITAEGVKGSPKIVEIRQDASTTYVENLNLGIPNSYSLEQNYPNPFNPTTKIRYALPKDGNVALTIYNILGEEVARIVNGYQSAGYYGANFDATKLTSGIYIYTVTVNNFVSSRKMILLK